MRINSNAIPTRANLHKSSIAIALQNVEVRYRIPIERISTLKEHVIRRITGKSIGYRDFTALRNISLSIEAGDSVGIIGRNGAGKSTLLKVIARVQRPTKGNVFVHGRVAPLIELGAGFHPELTGRENIFLNGAMLGFSHDQMRSKFDSIVDFSGVEQFIDSPLRTYSSGMQARLGFSIAAEVDPDILIVDEVLSVGDEMFQQKCAARMNTFRDKGVTLLFVTHSLESIAAICTHAIWLNSGSLAYAGDVKSTIHTYRSSLLKESFAAAFEPHSDTSEELTASTSIS